MKSVTNYIKNTIATHTNNYAGRLNIEALRIIT